MSHRGPWSPKAIQAIAVGFFTKTKISLSGIIGENLSCKINQAWTGRKASSPPATLTEVVAMQAAEGIVISSLPQPWVLCATLTSQETLVQQGHVCYVVTTFWVGLKKTIPFQSSSSYIRLPARRLLLVFHLLVYCIGPSRWPTLMKANIFIVKNCEDSPCEGNHV